MYKVSVFDSKLNPDINENSVPPHYTPNAPTDVPDNEEIETKTLFKGKSFSGRWQFMEFGSWEFDDKEREKKRVILVFRDSYNKKLRKFVDPVQ